MNWQIVPLSEVVKQDFESIVEVQKTIRYPMVGVYSFGKGLFTKEIIKGDCSSYKTFFKLKSEHIVLSQLFGWEGAISLCSKEFEDSYVSSMFPTFLVDEQKLDRDFFGYYLHQKIVWDELKTKGVGMGDRRRTLNPSIFLSLSIPLPPISIQKAIVKKLEVVKRNVDLIEKLRTEQLKDFRILQNSIFNKLIEDENKIPIEQILISVGEQCEIDNSQFYKQVMVRTEHKGVLLRKLIKGNEIGSIQTKVKSGNFIISKIDARNGAMGFIPPDLEGAVVTKDFPVFDFIEGVNPKFFGYFSNTNYFDRACKKASEGSTNRVRLKIDRFYNIEMPFPNRIKQNEIVELLNRVHQIKRHQQLTNTELKALFPSVLDKAFKGEL